MVGLAELGTLVLGYCKVREIVHFRVGGKDFVLFF